ncbi:MAG TPA: aldose epimerase family protein [Verrucomicrobiae bacterium]|nr:aldose epimerase family protein [Verrucomicrobiae bacterium]
MQTPFIRTIVVGLSAVLIAASGCSTSSSSSGGGITEAPFGTMPDGTPITLYTLRNSKGAEATICNYGGVVTTLKMPDRNGNYSDVVLGFDNLNDYLKGDPFFGALIGRYGNRIAKGHFVLDGTEYTLPINNAPNSLHGGDKGFDKVVWQATPHPSSSAPSLELTYVSKDGEEGYPGNLSVKAVYTLTRDNGLKLEFTATTDKDTVVNLTHHSYFNLAGQGNVLNHVVMINADKFTPVDSTLIPTGELKPVDGTPFDFRTPTAIGARIGQNDEQLKFGNGYDHNWVLNNYTGVGGVRLAARVYEPTSGRVLEVFSDQPGLQFYSGNFLDGTLKGKGGWVYQFRNAFCMEPQHFPDSPNKPSFPSTELKPGQVYHSTIEYRFSVRQ